MRLGINYRKTKTKISERQKHTNEHMLLATNDSQINKMKMETL